LEDGKIVFNPATPSSSRGGSPRRIQARTPQAPRKPYLKRSIRTPKTPTTPPVVNGGSPSVDSPPRLAKSSFDTISTDASSTDNSFYNEMFDLAQPTSPPRMDRMKCPQQALFEEGSKGSGEFSRRSSKRSSKSSSQRRSPIGNEKYVEFRSNEQQSGDNCSASFLTQLFDFFAIGSCCQNNPIMTCGRMTAV
jgi:hypothetical protein